MRIPFYIFSFTFILILINGCSHKKLDRSAVTRVYTVEQMHSDIDVLEKKLFHFHPDPYHYTSKDSLHLFVQEIKKQITTPLTDIKFRFYARQIIAKLGCGHTALIPSKEYLKAIDSVDRNVMPIDVWLLENKKLYVKNYLLNDSLLKRGDEILSINGNKTEDIISKIYSTFPSDGLNETYKKQNLQADRLRYYYAAAYDYDTTYNVEVKTKDGSIKNFNIKQLHSFADTLKPKSNKKYTIIYKTTKASFKTDSLDPSLAIIDINNFAGRKWRKFVKLSFRYLKKHPEVKNLAIDLRDNGGGSVTKGNFFMSYLIAKPYATRFGRKANLLPLNPGIKMNLATRITPITFSIYPISWVRNKKWTHWFWRFPKKKNHFDGKLFVITNGRSFSMSVITASYLKYKAGATLIGEETGGTRSGSNAMLNGRIILPNSKAQLVIPFYRIDHMIDVPDSKHGLMPDYPVNYELQDLLKARDLEIEKVRFLIKAQ